MRELLLIGVTIAILGVEGRADVWNNRGSTTDPGSRDGARTAYDSLRGQVILYGGHQNATCGDPAVVQTWSYRYETNTWTNLAPANHPGQHVHFGMTYDSIHDRVLAFGGGDYPCPNQPEYDHLWAYDPGANTWTDLDLAMDPTAPRPTPRSQAHFVFVDSAGVAILYGGGRAMTPATYETWSYDFATNAWTDLAPPTRPSAAALYAAAFDSRRHQAVIFGGGFFGPQSNETWSYDAAVNQWTNRTVSGPTPNPDQDPAMVYDCHSDRFVLVDDSDVTWSLDPTTWAWQQEAPMPAAPAVHHFTFTYLPEADRTLLYPAEFTRQTWEYDDGLAPGSCTDPAGPWDGAIDAAPGPDADGNPGTGDGGGCCQTGDGGMSALGPLVLVLLGWRQQRRLR